MSEPRTLLVGCEVRIIAAGPFFGRVGNVAIPPNPKEPSWRVVELRATSEDPQQTVLVPGELLEPVAGDTAHAD